MISSSVLAEEGLQAQGVQDTQAAQREQPCPAPPATDEEPSTVRGSDPSSRLRDMWAITVSMVSIKLLNTRGVWGGRDTGGWTEALLCSAPSARCRGKSLPRVRRGFSALSGWSVTQRDATQSGAPQNTGFYRGAPNDCCSHHHLAVSSTQDSANRGQELCRTF